MNVGNIKTFQVQYLLLTSEVLEVLCFGGLKGYVPEW